MRELLRKRLADRSEEGFTLIELMVVVLIIAILLAIAIPTFLGARNRANDRAAQSSLRNALTAAKTIFTDSQDYTQANASAIQTNEPALTLVDDTVLTSASTPKTVSVKGVSATVWAASAMSKSGTCFGIKDDSASGGAGTTYSTPATASCNGTGAAGASQNTSW